MDRNGFRRINSSNSTTEDFAFSNSDVTYTRLSFGFLAGQKWVADNGLVFEIGAGAGRAFINRINDEQFDDSFDFLNIDILLRLSVGYRF